MNFNADTENQLKGKQSKMTDESDFTNQIDNNQNKNSIHCQFCNSVILKAKVANYTENEVSQRIVRIILLLLFFQYLFVNDFIRIILKVTFNWDDINPHLFTLIYSSICRWCTKRIRNRWLRVKTWETIGLLMTCLNSRILAFRIRCRIRNIWFALIVKWDPLDIMISRRKNVLLH